MRSGLFMPGMTRRRAISGGASLRKAELTVQQNTAANFPTLITDAIIGTGHEFWTNVQSDGGDIRFYTDSALTNRLPVEVEALNVGAKTCRLWTRCPSALTASTGTIWIGYGNTGSPLSQPAVDATFGSEEVWQDESYAGHDPGVDVSGNVTPGITGTALLATGGPFGGPARGFGTTHGVGTSDRIDTNSTGNPNVIALRAWVYVENGGANRIIFAIGSNVQLRYRNGGALELLYLFSGGGAEWRGGTIPLDAYTHVACVYDKTDPANDPALFINGSPVTLGFDSNSTGTPNAFTDMQVGSNLFGPETMDGIIAETRFRPAAISATGVAAEYANQNAPGSFWSISSGQAA